VFGTGVVVVLVDWCLLMSLEGEGVVVVGVGGREAGRQAAAAVF
jgi:hypothetical protein